MRIMRRRRIRPALIGAVVLLALMLSACTGKPAEPKETGITEATENPMDTKNPETTETLMETEETTLKAGYEITSFDTVLLSESGMRSYDEWEFTRTESGADFLHYSGGWEWQDGVSREDCLQEEIRGDAAFYEELIRLFNDCGLSAWDGFKGPNPEDVQDGTMFELTAVINGGKQVRAEGSNNYPEGYRILTDGIRALEKRAGEADGEK